MDAPRLSNLLADDSPAATLAEVEEILARISYRFDYGPVRAAFFKTVDLYTGGYPGYLGCNTGYHDLAHTMDTFLAMARLCHGGMILGAGFTEQQIFVGLVSALLHDCGYIQEEGDDQGTGARYTSTHVERGMAFVGSHGKDFGLTSAEIDTVRLMFLYTDLSMPFDSISAPEEWAFHMGELLGAADIFSQVSDRLYLEKLLFLYFEFREGMVGDYQDEVDLLRQTDSFYELMDDRFRDVRERLNQYLLAHFKDRWGLETNFYEVAAIRNRSYLNRILRQPGDPRGNLKRNNIVKQVLSRQEGAV